MKKLYSLSETTIEKLKKIQVDNELSTESGTIEFLVNSYFEKIELTNKNKLEQEIILLKKIVRNSEKNTDLILDGLNTILHQQSYMELYSFKENPAVVLKASENKRKEKLNKKKHTNEFGLI